MAKKFSELFNEVTTEKSVSENDKIELIKVIRKRLSHSIEIINNLTVKRFHFFKYKNTNIPELEWIKHYGKFHSRLVFNDDGVSVEVEENKYSFNSFKIHEVFIKGITHEISTFVRWVGYKYEEIEQEKSFREAIDEAKYFRKKLQEYSNLVETVETMININEHKLKEYYGFKRSRKNREKHNNDLLSRLYYSGYISKRIFNKVQETLKAFEKEGIYRPYVYPLIDHSDGVNFEFNEEAIEIELDVKGMFTVYDLRIEDEEKPYSTYSISELIEWLKNIIDKQ